MKKRKAHKKKTNTAQSCPFPLFEDKTEKINYCPQKDEVMWVFEKGKYPLAGKQYVVEQAMLEASFNTSSRYGMNRPFKRVVIQAIIFEQ